MRLLVDTSVVLDLLEDRAPFAEDAVRLFDRIRAGEIEGFISATTVTDIYYLIRKLSGAARARIAVDRVLDDLQICTVDRAILVRAAALEFQDFEDAVQ